MLRFSFRAQPSLSTPNLLGLGRRSRPLSRRLDIVQAADGTSELVLQDGRRLPWSLVLQAAAQQFDHQGVMIAGRRVHWSNLSAEAKARRVTEMVCDDGLAEQLWGALAQR